MAKIFGIHVALMRGIEVAQFAPGDEVPEWALDLVGDHCLILPPSDEEIHEGDGSTPETHEDDEAKTRMENEGAPSTPPAKGSAPLSFTGAEEKKPATKARGKKA